MFNGNWIYFFFIFFFGVSCHKSGLDETINHPTGERYLHLAHTRTEFNPYMISHIEDIDYSNYSLLMLGGDLTADSSSEEEILQYLDAICDLGNINTLWTLGNHDYYDIDNVKAYTNRPNYYSYFKNDICFIVLDTQDSLCHITGAQKEFFNQVMDTLRNASYLMVLHHKLIWMPDHPELEASISDISNGHLSHQAHHLYHNNFYQDIYPRLLEVQAKGIQTYCVGGDLGIHAHRFEYTNESGIVFLASGVFFKNTTNYALVFYHDLSNNLAI